ncbi:glycosyltransferase family 4 protein [Brevundimonas sp. TWP2-3-2]|uniref:glycosyltransferase family 4 protein n=1 Tax=unclassified Brevundimonas TaxID=2622653 RepID=UPI003CFA806F
MGNAALYLNPEAFNTGLPALMGRQSAGESFLKGYLRHSTADDFHFWNVANAAPHTLQGFIEAIGSIGKPMTVIPRHDRRQLGAAGNAFLPSPNLARESWHRRVANCTEAYGITGITHTTASDNIMDALADMLTAPVEPWDTLICTSSAVRASVEVELEAVRADLEERVGARRLGEPQLATIPLGINVDDFATTGDDRARWRNQLGIADEAVVVLYVGRFNPHAKMNPLPMALALEQAAQIAGKPIAWVQAGWGLSETQEKAYHDQTRALCPSVDYHVVDARKPDARFSIWSVGDIFISLSDNIQETFGLTPVEAMAAGIPCVVSDWDGYRDTIRHGIDGFRASTYAPKAGAGQDLAYQYANQWISYDTYAGATSQLIAVDVVEAARALADLVSNPDLRKRMGQAAAARARDTFDWKVVIPQYEALWAEQTRRRLASAGRVARPRNLAPHPRRLDPFLLFGGYASEWLTSSTMVTLRPGTDEAALAAIRGLSLAVYGSHALPTTSELTLLIERLSRVRQITVGELVGVFPAGRRPFVERGVLYLAKYDLVRILPRSDVIAR